MNIKNLKYIFFALLGLVITSCETYPDQEVEVGPIYPLAGEWQIHVYDQAGTNLIAKTSSNPTGVTTFRTYNLANNSKDSAWVRLGTTQAYALLGKVTCNVGAKSISGTNVSNVTKGGTFSIEEFKLLLNAQSLHSGTTADSIYMRYTSSTAAGKTYTIMGHRRTQWDPLE